MHAVGWYRGIKQYDLFQRSTRPSSDDDSVSDIGTCRLGCGTKNKTDAKGKQRDKKTLQRKKQQ